MLFKRQKQGQGGIEISVLVILIAMFIVIYVILLPPAERDELLNETSITLPGLPVGAKVILSESPGNVFSYSKNIQTAKIEPIHLYSRDNAETTSLVKGLRIARNLLKDSYRTILFTIDDIDTLKELKLFMLVSDSQGRLTIRLNDNIVYQGFLTGDQLPITLPTQYLKTNNKLEFSLNLPGVTEFYKTNYYLLEDVSLIKVHSKTKKETERFFFVDMEENQKVKNVKLHYILSCNSLDERGSLDIKLNGRLQSKDAVFCEYNDEIILPLEEEDLNKDGRNLLSFKIDKGDYSLEQVRIVSELTKSTYPKYVFDIDSDEF
ncbi:MAG: hypothetical protein KKA65_01765, partial [Nanoarchaeota archaeon]|nr:hypothetical protein [Nanoarchaeota archaeon]